MFSDNELRLKRLCRFPLGSPFRSLCMMLLSAAKMSQKSVWVGRFVNPAASPQISVPHVPVLCSCVAWLVLELCTVSSGFSFLTPLWEGLC